MELTQMEYEFWPEALEATIRYASAATGLPVIVTENGVATDDDTRRIAYVERALRGVAAWDALRVHMDSEHAPLVAVSGGITSGL